MAHIDVYQTQLVARKASSVGEPKLNDGGRVLLPSMALQQISNLSVVYPLQFRIDAYRQRPVWAGVLEFSAETGTVVMPDWMFEQLELSGNAIVRLQTCSLGSGNLLKLRPHETAFVMLSDPRLVLEQRLVNYPVLTKGTTIVLHYARHSFKMDVVDILSAQGRSLDAVLTARADTEATELRVEFERPLDSPPTPTSDDDVAASSPTGANIIGGSPVGGGIQFTPFTFKPPTLLEGSAGSGDATAPTAPASSETAEPSFVPFTGAGRTLSGGAAASPALVKPLTPEQQRELREKRLRAFERRS